MNRLPRGVSLLALAWCLAACAPLAWPDQPRRDGSALPLNAETVIGQRVVAREAGLTAIDVFLSPSASSSGGGQLALHLRADPQAAQSVGVAELPVSAVTQPDYYRFDLETLPGSLRADYFIQLVLTGDGEVLASTAPADSYDQGAIYLDGKPQAAQLSFRLVYAPGYLIWGWIRDFGLGLGWFLVAVCLFTLPGAALLRWLYPAEASLDGTARLALAVGLGLAIPPVWLLWTSAIGLRLGPLHAWLPPLLALIALAIGRRWRVGPAGEVPPPIRTLGQRVLRRPNVRPEGAALAVVVTAIFAVRFWAIRSLDGPMWGDSVQHAFMTQLILDQGGLFQSWQPYAPFISLTNQYGFSAVSASLAWLAGADVLQATLVTGQLLNGFACLSLYPLAVKLSRGSRWAGVAAVTIAGLLSATPAVYVNWGRYAQLTGLAILPAALTLTWLAVERAVSGSSASQPPTDQQLHRHWATLGAVALAGLAVTGVSLSYYRMAFFVAAFFAPWLLAWALPRWRARPQAWGAAAAALSLTVLASGWWALPWLPRLSRSNLAGFVGAGLTLRPEPAAVAADLGLWQTLPQYSSWGMLLIAAIGLVAGLRQRRWELAVLPVWYALLSLYAVGSLIGLPVASMLEQFTLVVAAYVPVSLLCGWLFGAAFERLSRRRPAAGTWPAFCALVALAALGAASQRAISQPATQALLTRPDLRAAAWMQANTPPDSVVLIESYSSTYNSAVGSDAGWWLPIIARRATTMPPRYALLSEAPADSAYPRQVVDLVRAIEAGGVAAPEALRLMCALHVTHAYVGQRQGLIGANPAQLFSAAELEASTLFDPIYHEDRVSIFALRPGVCRA